MGDFKSSVRSQIQRAMQEAINEEILPQIQATTRSEQRQCLREGERFRLEDWDTDLKKF